MAERTDRGGFLRLSLKRREPVTLTKQSASAVEGKSSLLPTYRGGGFQPDFVPLDAHGNVIDILEGGSALAFAAYWYVATRWRAQKLAEAPLIVVEEDQEDGSEEWLPDHDLAGILDNPHPDFDMTDLVERTSRYLDDCGQAIWVIDRDRAKRVARLTPFKRSEFEVKRTEDRLFGQFIVQTYEGPRTFDASEVVYFRDTVEGWDQNGRSRLDVAMSWLRLGESARSTVRDLLDNAVWPSVVAVPDVTWNPTPEMLELYKAELNAYAQPGNKGKAFAMLGGGRLDQMSARIRDLVPTEVLDRVESVVASVSGVPAIVLQFQIGLENSPWSQMEQARRMAYDDVIQPAWRKIERTLTRQVLRLDDEDLTHFVRFDRSVVAALQTDRMEAASVAQMIGRQASLNERREIIGLDPLDDPAADEVPELTPVIPPPGAAGDGTDPTDGTDPNSPAGKAARRKRRVKAAAMSIALRDESAGGFEHFANRLLANDANEVERIVLRTLSEPEKTSIKSDRGRDKVMTAILGYLRHTSEPAWGKATKPLITHATERATAVIAADLGVSYNLLHPHVVKFATAESSWLVTNISSTTRDSIAGALARGLEAGKSTNEIARDIANSGAFAPSRARLIARTESTRSSAGGPTKSLQSYAKASGRKYTKSWSGALDDRERDEHIAMEGETVPIDEEFSNGLQFPSEPNCRCAPIFNEVDE